MSFIQAVIDRWDFSDLSRREAQGAFLDTVYGSSAEDLYSALVNVPDFSTYRKYAIIRAIIMKGDARIASLVLVNIRPLAPVYARVLAGVIVLRQDALWISNAEKELIAQKSRLFNKRMLRMLRISWQSNSHKE